MGSFQVKEVLVRLNKEAIGAKTYNARLYILRAFFTWVLKEYLID